MFSLRPLFRLPSPRPSQFTRVSIPRRALSKSSPLAEATPVSVFPVNETTATEATKSETSASDNPVSETTATERINSNKSPNETQTITEGGLSKLATRILSHKKRTIKPPGSIASPQKQAQLAAKEAKPAPCWPAGENGVVKSWAISPNRHLIIRKQMLSNVPAIEIRKFRASTTKVSGLGRSALLTIEQWKELSKIVGEVESELKAQGWWDEPPTWIYSDIESASPSRKGKDEGKRAGELVENAED